MLHTNARLPQHSARIRLHAPDERASIGRKGAPAFVRRLLCRNREQYDARAADDKMFLSEECFVVGGIGDPSAKVWRICIKRPHSTDGLNGMGKRGERVHGAAASFAAAATGKDEKNECEGASGRRRGCANCDRRTAAARRAVPRRSHWAGAEHESPRAPRCSGRYPHGSSRPACRHCRPRAPAFALRR